MTKQKSKNSTSALKVDGKPTKERCRQNGGVIPEIVVCDGASVDRYRAAWECPLDAYKDKKIITEPEHRAGLHFRQAYHRAVLSRRADYERLNRYPAIEGLTMNEKLIRDAQRTLSPHNMWAVIDICGYDQPAKDATMLDKLKKGLGHLAVRWNMAAIEVCEHKPKTI